MLRLLKNTLGAVASSAISLHVVVSALQNTPDDFNLDLRPFTGGWPLPGWRFFAPNPGIQNVHLLVRTRSLDTVAAENASGPWVDITPPIYHSPLNVLWNPRSRGPKALFDCMQQLAAMKTNYASFDYIIQSQPYSLIADSCLGYLDDSNISEYQFTLINYFPSETDARKIAPVLVSEWIPTDQKGD